jgi:DNA-binding response OmpR family regulator
VDKQQVIAAAQAVQQRARALAQDGFNRDRARDIYEAADALVDPCMEAELTELGEALLGYGAYLSSFVDSSMMPSGPQLQQLQALLDALGEALQRQASDVRVSTLSLAADEIRVQQPTVYVWSRHRGLDRALDHLLAKVNMRAVAVTDVAALLRGLKEGDGRGLVLDVEHVGTLAELQQRLPDSAAALLKVPILAVSVRDDLALRLQAIRANVDGFAVLPGELAAAAQRLVELIDDRHRPYQVLVIDDDASMTLFCTSVLRHNGMQTASVNEPEQAFEALKDFSPDVILVDLYMPGINGLEMLALFRQHRATLFTPVILLSGDDDAEKRFDALVVGGDDYLTKPIRPRHLVAAVSQRARRARWMKRELLRGS